MPDVKELSTATQDNILSVMKMSQTATLEAVRNWIDTVDRFTPDLPIPTMPGLDKLPTPAEGMSMGFGFAEKLLDNQKEFATSLLAAVMPPAPKPAGKAPKS
jgi:hypothetical protein